MEIAGSLALTGSAQQLTSTVEFARAIKFMQAPTNTHPIFWGDSSLDSATNTGVNGIVPPPTAENPNPERSVDALAHGSPLLMPTFIYVQGESGETLLWSYQQA